MEWQINLNQNVLPHEEHSIIAQHLQKYPKLVASLALIFHLIEGLISEQSISMALEWCKYLESHTRRIYGLVLDASTSKAASLAKRLKRLSEDHDWIVHGFKARDIHRKNWKSLTDIQSVETALDILVDYHWLAVREIATTLKGGRPTQHYMINPKVFAS